MGKVLEMSEDPKERLVNQQHVDKIEEKRVC